MNEVTIIGIDLAKHHFQLHGSHADGSVAMEACGGAHHWAREIRSLGHRVRLIAPTYVKPYVKRQKNDQADAEAVAEAASRPTMRCVTHGQDPGTAGEKHTVSDAGADQGARRGAVGCDDTRLDKLAREMGNAMMSQIRRLRAIPGVGPITGLAFIVFNPDREDFRCGWDFAAWLGLVPKQHSSGGKARLGKVSKRGQRNLRRLLIGGPKAARWSGLLHRGQFHHIFMSPPGWGRLCHYFRIGKRFLRGKNPPLCIFGDKSDQHFK